MARSRTESWALLRLSMGYLKETEEGWRTRKLEECTRIREEEKEDRLAVAREKKRKYGIKKISKEENIRLKMRTGERLEIASAKANLWKKYREGGKCVNQKEMEEWEGMRTSVMILEEGGGWIEDTESARRLARITFVMKKGAQLGGGQDHEGEGADGGADRDRAEGDGGAQDGDTREGE